MSFRNLKNLKFLKKVRIYKNIHFLYSVKSVSNKKRTIFLRKLENIKNINFLDSMKSFSFY